MRNFSLVGRNTEAPGHNAIPYRSFIRLMSFCQAICSKWISPDLHLTACPPVHELVVESLSLLSSFLLLFLLLYIVLWTYIATFQLCDQFLSALSDRSYKHMGTICVDRKTSGGGELQLARGSLMKEESTLLGFLACRQLCC